MDFRECLPNLVKLYLENCNTFDELPPLGSLPSLQILKIEGTFSVQSLGQEFYYQRRVTEKKEISTEISVFPSLVELSLIDMSNLEDWAAPRHSFNSFPSLKKVIVRGCLRLKSMPLISFPSLERLEFCNTNDEVVNRILAGKGGERLTSLPSVSIQFSPELQFFPVWLLPNDTHIQSLEIAHCSNFKGFRILDRKEFQAQVSSNTTRFTTSISSLCSLKLFDCPRLKSVLDLRECTCLTKLWIDNCGKVVEPFSYDLASLPSLQTLYVDRIIDLLPRQKERISLTNIPFVPLLSDLV